MNLIELKFIFKQAASKIQVLSDEDALSNKTLYLNFKDLIGKTLPINYKLIYDDKLYKTIQDNILVQEQYPPSIETASLYTEINEKYEGTIENPIPYNGNMALEEGKYYVQDNIIYKCIRSTEIAIFADLKNLINIYVVNI